MLNHVKNIKTLTRLFSFFLAIILISCNSNHKENPIIVESLDETENHLITITDSQFASSNMALGNITKQEFNTYVKANGIFDVPPENKATVSAYFAGYVKNITLLPGNIVKKGQELFTLENPDYVQIQQDFLEAKSNLSYLKADYERQKSLMVDNITSQKNFLKAESEYKVTHTKFQSLQKKLSLMNINPNTLTGESIRSVISVTAPISGVVTSIQASKGMFLNASDIAMTVTNTEHLHLELKIFENDLPFIKVEQPIIIRLQNNDEKVYHGKVHLINKSINTTERTIDIHGDLVNADDTKLFAPGMYLEAQIVTSSKTLEALPIEAVIDIENDYYGLIKQENHTFKKVILKVGKTSNGFIEILNAQEFSPNTEFLTKGAFNLISE
ncbi:MAG: efflux RND transporter periplasmic adaptor subunit [Flavobacteriales bacterium]|nr:efflux RND transporter periplasmic adaptor subunit [Flavobacteriia bacterium]NCP06677.1 efflux RND transporter periplasmic adaptor subunit [Flavobacteriales bacterium]PIV93711.1 MAG: efflux RND transporter periplasmic adaptor subunit [Flavobacteriaceae bacterium CG17_big_fil_post_rev_8_21_14_2_50_33_15]NCP51562.1 efflux RND transporter periplasmic adaptor subunit [Flavobacteriales bacterium]NCP59735.1 efflux RND transporter periplasmic adaptor subunit [Flavobacteriales bacterium]